MLGKAVSVLSHALALICAGWYVSIQLDIVRYDLADMFGLVMLMVCPIAFILLLLQIIDMKNQAYSRPILRWSVFLNGLMILISGLFWFQLLTFFSNLDGFGLGST